MRVLLAISPCLRRPPASRYRGDDDSILAGLAEMDEIAAKLAESGLPPGFHEACRRCLPSLVTVAEPSLDGVIAALLGWS